MPTNRIRPEDLLLLNEEIRALVRARVPVASELRSAARGVSGPAARAAERLALRMEQGDSLGDALAAEGSGFPPFYAAVVRAGVASGRLPAALEAFSLSFQRLVALRRLMWLSLAYPVAIAAAALGLLPFAAAWFLPRYEWIGVTDRLGLTLFRSPGVAGAALLGVGGLIVAAFGLNAWLRGRGERGNGERGPGELVGGLGGLALLPGVRRVLRLTASTTYAELLSLLVRHGAPLDEAVRRAAEAAGWPPFDPPSRRLAERLASGHTARQAKEELRWLPPLVRMSLLMAESSGTLADALTAAAAAYERRARLTADRLAVLFPAVATAAIGGVAVGVYGVMMLRPYAQSLLEITTWH